MGIDVSILDAARIDRAGEWRILGRIVLPMSGPWSRSSRCSASATGTRSSTRPLRRRNAKWPLQLVLRSYVLQGVTLPGSGVGQVDVATGAVTGLPVKMAIWS